MLNLTNAGTDKLQVITGVGSSSIQCHVSWVDLPTGVSPTPVPGRTNTAISTATTTDVCATPAASTNRNVKTIHIYNDHATVSQDVTIQYNANATLVPLFKATIAPGECIEYIEGVGFFVIRATTKLDAKLRVGSDVTNATTSFADITGLTCPVISGRHYAFEAHLYHIENASTTGAQFGIGGVTMTGMRIQEIGSVIPSVTASTMQTNTADVTAINTAAIVATASATTPSVNIAILSGWFNPSQTGTFAIRCASEVAVASGLIVKQGSWARVWECDN
jgi:hypothetical protein